MKKIIFGTASIIRGEFHKQTIGKIYNIYSEILKKFEIYHIINIDQPENLRNYFNMYETIFLFDQIIPDFVKKIYITPKNPSFASAFNNIINKANEIMDENSLFWWLEDDWEPKNVYNFIEIIKNFLNLENCSFTFSTNAPFGSFRGGPLMNYSYFKKYFYIEPNIINNSDPEKKISKVVRKIYNDKIQIIGICNNKDIDNLHLYYYFRKKIPFEVFIINNKKIFEYSNNIFTEVNNNVFNNSKIKYFVISPYLFNDEKLGKNFLEKYLLNKWGLKQNEVTYTNPSFLTAYIGNWNSLPINNLRLQPKYTCNKNFFNSITYILKCLPYIEKNYTEKINIKYYSHIFGNYPNFEVFGKSISLAYTPTLTNKKSDELICLIKLSKICEDSEFLLFKDNFKLVKEYFDRYFIISEDIWNEVNLFTKSFSNVLGIHFSGINENCSYKNFITILNYDLNNYNYEKIFVVTDDIEFIKELKKNINLPFILYNKNEDSKLNYISRQENISSIISKIKKANFKEKIILENELKNETYYNQKFLEKSLINSLILSKCKKVIKTHSQLSAYAKIFNPKLEIYRTNKNNYTNYWPDSHIPLYENIKI